MTALKGRIASMNEQGSRDMAVIACAVGTLRVYLFAVVEREG